MNQRSVSTLLVAGAALLAAGPAQALEYNQNVTPDVIFGSGNANGAFTTDTDGGVELGLRAKMRIPPSNTFNSNGNGTYSFAAGLGAAPNRPIWNFEWSVNSDVAGTSGNTLNDFTYRLGIDSNPTFGTTFVEWDPIMGVTSWDHSLGNNSTGNGAGIENGGGILGVPAGQYATDLGNYNVAQNSWAPNWFVPGFDPTVAGTYDIYLAAYSGSTEVARTHIQVIVGGGAVPDAGSTAMLMGTALAGLGYAARRKRA